MSAYALPGLFPPIEGLSLYSKDSSYESKRSCSGDTASTSGNSDTASKPSSPSVPLHKTESNTISGSRINVLGDAVMASVDKLSYMLSTGEAIPSGSSSSSSSSSDSSDCPGIAVKEAKIDPVRLVQCVTSSAQKKPQGKTLRKRGSRERLDKTNQSTTKDNNPHGEAIEFELSISFNGRKYTATRTLQCIMQLRNDLIREMNTRRRWLQQYGGVGSGPSSPAPRPTTTYTTTRSSAPNTVDSDGDDESFEIPEIPPLTGDDESKGGSFVGRGFSMLHAMATSYVPVMESWLRNVLAIVPQDSECLSNFLWEPLNDMPALEAAFPSSPSMSGLDSIRELDYNTGDDDDSEDEWE